MRGGGYEAGEVSQWSPFWENDDCAAGVLPVDTVCPQEKGGRVELMRATATRGGGGLQQHMMRWGRRQCGINLGAKSGGYTAFGCGCGHHSPRRSCAHRSCIRYQ